MSIALKSPSSSRISGLLIFLGLPALLLTFSALQALEAEDNRVLAQEKEFQLTTLMRRLTAPAKDGKPLDLSRIYIAADTATLAGANLQKLVVQSVTGASGKIIETSVLDASEDQTNQAQQTVGIHASFDINNDGLLSVLRGLESGLPLVFVDRISIRRLPGDTDSGSSDMLRVDVAVSARWKAAS